MRKTYSCPNVNKEEIPASAGGLAPYYLAECFEKGSGVEADENAAVMY